jgi:16S rRNA C967 or C1407 C5-methylase (RsmB/RsmF family)
MSSSSTLHTFCERNGINPQLYQQAHSIPRFIRLKKPLTNENDNTSLLTSMKLVNWLPEHFQFYQLDSNITISNSSHYKQGHIYGLDISSAMAVFALDPKCDEHVLDMCCAPGAKLCFISDYVRATTNENISLDKTYITGLDINIDRLNTCKNILKRYDVKNVRLLLADGTSYSVQNAPSRIPGRKLKRQLTKWLDQQITSGEVHVQLPGTSNTTNGIVFHETNGSFLTLRIEQEKQNARRTTDSIDTTDLPTNNTPIYYDKIIVDAECTTDGSVKHIMKMVEQGWDFYHEKYFNDKRMKEITELQRNLINNAFSVLKPNGGILVYSTCSFTREQNEHVIEWFLKNNPNAKLIPPFENTQVDTNQIPYRNGFIEHTIRFDPLHSNTSGLFIAKIMKL